MNSIINSALSLSIMGLVFGAGLAYASKKFSVEIDIKEESILNALPGANCGGCGYPGCAGLASAICKGIASVDSCPVGGKEVTEKISLIMGVKANEGAKLIANVICNGSSNYAKNKSFYKGIIDCKAASLVSNGPKECSYGCIGYGTCVNVCIFDAIHICEDGIAHVDEDKCVGCGKCIEDCPKSVIHWKPYGKHVSVDCNSKEKGKDVKEKCQVGCIGCKICVNNCPYEAITFENNLACINYDKCTQCLICVEKCPTKTISNKI